ncbi:hypothetical protein ACC732_06090 [Rhizobium ruizarguesonis]
MKRMLPLSGHTVSGSPLAPVLQRGRRLFLNPPSLLSDLQDLGSGRVAKSVRGEEHYLPVSGVSDPGIVMMISAAV